MITKNQKIAFITDEYPSTSPRAGGLATYVARMAQLLASYGHEVHVFVPAKSDRNFSDLGVQIHEVAPFKTWFSSLESIVKHSSYAKKKFYDQVIHELGISFALAKVFSAYEHQFGFFDWVQSADYRFRGLFVSARKRPHIVRCSWARDLWNHYIGISHLRHERIYEWIERFVVSRASKAYAPSQFISDYLWNKYRISIDVIRPPMRVATSALSDCNRLALPAKFLIFHGQFFPVKGSDYLMDAVELLNKTDRPITLCVAGITYDEASLARMEKLGIVYLGAMLRSELMSVISLATASVLPSRADNIPNTAIESLSLGIPVITMNKSSIDELVVDGVNGWVVEQGDVSALADVMWVAWNNPHPNLKKPAHLCAGAIFQSMEPRNAVDQLLALVRSATKD